MLTIRVANQQDAAELLKIYAPYVTETTISFEWDVPTLADFKQRITTTLVDYPFLVAEDQAGTILGYAYAHAYNPRPGYAWTAEATIYLSPKAKGQGVGRQLYECLEKEAKKQNIRHLVACITGENKVSRAFHERSGYRHVAEFPQFAYKFGDWYDIVWMQKTLVEVPKDLLPLVPFSKL